MRPHLTRRPVYRQAAVVVCGAVVLVTGLAREGAGRARREAAHPPAIPAAPLPRAGERVLVVAPHPDDETLALGGLIRQARRNGARVQVVFLTNGDGFALAAAAKYRRWPGRSAMRRLARDRQSEARAALAGLDVGPASLTFLGYPDRGLSSLWLERWSSAYRSPYTGEAAVPAGFFRPGAPYTGRSVVQDLEAILERAGADRIYYPDSTDDHPDHWATSCFTRMALERHGAPRPPVAATYLVHRGQWPRPLEEDERLFLHPPAELAPLGIPWQGVTVDPEALAAKKEALRQYRSQEALAGNFLNAFLRRNELLVAPGGEASGGRDAVRDRWGRARLGGADFTALRWRSDGKEAFLTAELREVPLAGVTYALSWKPLGGPLDRTATRSCRITGFRAAPDGTRFSVAGRTITLRIPLEQFPPGRVMIGAAAWSGPVLLDRTAWWVVADPRSAPRAEPSVAPAASPG